MIGPRASGPRKFAREVFPEPALRERAGFGTRISSFDIAITWVTRKASASCFPLVVPALNRDPGVSAIALIATPRPLVIALGPDGFLKINISGYGSRLKAGTR